MAANAFVLGFFTAMGWFSAHKVLATLDHTEKPITILERKEK